MRKYYFECDMILRTTETNKSATSHMLQLSNRGLSLLPTLTPQVGFDYTPEYLLKVIGVDLL